MSRAVVFAAAGLAAGLFLLSRRAAAQESGAEVGSVGSWYAPSVPGVVDGIESGAFTPNLSELEQMSGGDQNLVAFLKVIESAEGTARGGRDPYRTCYGYAHTIQSFADHPAVRGEWAGEKLSDAMCRGAGLSPGCVSTAAGRYQILKKTWLRAKAALSLPDFSPESQDRAAEWLIAGRGALADVRAGNFDIAIEKCRKEWASLPGAGYGQPERKLADLREVFEVNGGVLA